MLRYTFTITIGAEADTPEEAWQKALLDLALHSAEMPGTWDETTKDADYPELYNYWIKPEQTPTEKKQVGTDR